MSDSPFIVWLSNYGQIVLFFAQLLFWIALGVAAVWATLLFKRLVDFKVGKVAEAPAAAAVPEAAAVADQPVAVDEFVD